MPNFVGCRCCGSRGKITHRLFDDSGNQLWAKDFTKQLATPNAIICRDGQSVVAWDSANPKVVKYSITNGGVLHTNTSVAFSPYYRAVNSPVGTDLSGNVYAALGTNLLAFNPDLTSKWSVSFPPSGLNPALLYLAVSPDDSKIAVLQFKLTSTPSVKCEAELFEFDNTGSVQWNAGWSITGSISTESPPWTLAYDLSNTLWTGCYYLANKTMQKTGGSGGPYKSFVSWDSSGAITADKYGVGVFEWSVTNYGEGLPYFYSNLPAYVIYDPDGSGSGHPGRQIYGSYPKAIGHFHANTSGDRIAVTHGDGLYFFPSDLSSLLWSFPETAFSSFTINCIDGYELIGGPLRSR